MLLCFYRWLAFGVLKKLEVVTQKFELLGKLWENSRSTNKLLGFYANECSLNELIGYVTYGGIPFLKMDLLHYPPRCCVLVEFSSVNLKD